MQGMQTIHDYHVSWRGIAKGCKQGANWGYKIFLAREPVVYFNWIGLVTTSVRFGFWALIRIRLNSKTWHILWANWDPGTDPLFYHFVGGTHICKMWGFLIFCYNGPFCVLLLHSRNYPDGPYLSRYPAKFFPLAESNTSHNTKVYPMNRTFGNWGAVQIVLAAHICPQLRDSFWTIILLCCHSEWRRLTFVLLWWR